MKISHSSLNECTKITDVMLYYIILLFYYNIKHFINVIFSINTINLNCIITI